ncbi:MAG: hypothetical protein ABR615_00330, partial [Pseudonocardiaceae bacterium]
AAGALILTAGGFGIAAATGALGDNEQVSGSTAQVARAAAAQAVPGGIAGQVLSESDGYGVQVSKPDGTKSEVHLDKTFKPLTVGPAVNGGDGDGPDGDEG